jgi:hypothetical protein
MAARISSPEQRISSKVATVLMEAINAGLLTMDEGNEIVAKMSQRAKADIDPQG